MVFVQCSGNWNNAANAGVFYRNWNNNRSNDNTNNGFRSCDYDSCPETFYKDAGNIGSYLSCLLAKSARHGVLVVKANVHHA